MRTLIDPGLLKSQAYFNGAFVGEASVVVTNPANGDVVGKVPNHGASEATEAVEAAAEAFHPWAAKTAKERSPVLRKWFDLILANKWDLATILTSEQGKPRRGARRD